ncbi:MULTISPECIES: SPW_0924 family protein [Streptomyces]|nr:MULTISPECIES: SPW_0924 family protein [unclassified Streptomyces]
MRAFVAAVIGLAAALALVSAITAFGVPEGETSPRPLLTTAPPAPGK